MKLNKNLAVSETGFIFNPTSGDSFTANEIGTEIINLMKESKSIADIKTALLDKYDVEGNQLEKDVDDFMVLLRDNNLIQYER
ncbi:MAG: PqqD family protein [Sphingobacteriales bacterium JAD_PAG50586_3]|nr:MAG: PqqD family protein [Sphingobacteriales bacterium JAD_PAG50586_3]